MDIDNKNIFFYPFTELTLPSTIKETTPETRLAANSPQSENGMIPVADADPESFDSDNGFFIFHVVLVDEGREDPNNTKRAVIGPPAKLHLMALVALEGLVLK